MRRLLVVLCVPAFFATLAPAAPVPKHLLKNQEPVYYYPTTVGAKWVYDEPGGDRVLVVSEVKDRKGAKVVTVVEENVNGPFVREVIAVSEVGLARLSMGSATFDAPQAMLQSPFRVGTTWQVKAPAVDGAKTIAAVERIKIPAGTFEAVRVDANTSFGGAAPLIYSTWYAPGVGLLKITEGNKVHLLLKSFTPGK